ncbi:MAG: ABC transporter substrate-binding protein [Dehalococcoidia bacterium]|nr:ABC transporter substrate-binding protein [Dehalococcoidia bacterium]
MGQDRADTIWETPLTRRQLMSAMAVGGTTLALVGCGDDDAPSSAEPQASTQPKRGGSIIMQSGSATASAPSLKDPQKIISLSSCDAWSLVGNTVLRADWKTGTALPGLAEKWEFPDPTTMLIHLKKGTHFQKESAAAGREIDSGDVVASMERVRTPNDPTFTIARAFRLVNTYEAVDKYTVRVKFKSPDANFLSWLWHPHAGIVLPREAIQKFPDMSVAEAFYGSGPFIPDISTLRPGVSLSFRRNPSYDVDPGGLPYLDKATIIWISDPSAQLAALRTGQIDIGLVDTLEQKAFQSSHQLGSTEDLITAASHLAMNVELAPTNDARVRQAMHRAIDREALVQVVGDGFGCAVFILGCRSSVYLGQKEWDGKPGYRKNHNEDVAEAKKMLAATGVDAAKTPLKMWQSPTSPQKVLRDQAIALKGMLERELGFKIELDLTVAGYPTAAQAKEKGLQLSAISNGGLGGLILDDPLWAHYHKDATNNSSVWFDKKTDDLIEKQASALDFQERRKIFAELQRYLLDDQQLPGSPTVRNNVWFGAKKSIRSWTAPGYFLSNYAWQFSQVWLDE